MSSTRKSQQLGRRTNTLLPAYGAVLIPPRVIYSIRPYAIEVLVRVPSLLFSSRFASDRSVFLGQFWAISRRRREKKEFLVSFEVL